MKVINIHKRQIQKPEKELGRLFITLATPEDKLWPNQNWPAMKFKNGLHVGSKGGHGRIRYTIVEFIEGRYVKFQFTRPEGFKGTHELEILKITEHTTEISHKIEMHTTTLKASLMWSFMIRWLHDALIEEAFDTVERYPLQSKTTNYGIWVTFLRYVFQRKSFKIKLA